MPEPRNEATYAPGHDMMHPDLGPPRGANLPAMQGLPKKKKKRNKKTNPTSFPKGVAPGPQAAGKAAVRPRPSRPASVTTKG